MDEQPQPGSDAAGPSADESKRSSKKEKKRQKKQKGRGFFRSALDIAFRILPFVGIRVPGSLKSVAKGVLKGSGVKMPGGLGGKGGDFSGGGNLRDAGRLAGRMAQAAAVAGTFPGAGTSGAPVPQAGDSSGAIEGVTIEVFAQATAAMGRAAQSGGNYEQGLAALGLDLAKYQRVTSGFTVLMQQDTSLAARYAQAYQSAMSS